MNNLNRRNVSDDELCTAENNFAVVEASIEKIDWLHLRHNGHLRASFNYRTSEKTWLEV